ncbi:serine/threonine-protein kinase [Ureaplasma ceti]|uniref:Serine/threonine-protein kinase n=1 Tax=Ureaplasma ceti TaxID=3119530 RepID=A0ABP9U763_9BACT
MAKLNYAEKASVINKILLNKYKITNWWRDGGLSSIFEVLPVLDNNGHSLDESPSVSKIVKIIKLENQESKKLDDQKAFDELRLFQNHAYNDRHIVSIYDYYIDDNFLYLVLEKVSGESLDEQIRNGKIFTVEETVLLMGQLVTALKLMHTSYGQHQMIHRDIKPQNIIVDDKLKLTLIDFGISTMYDDIQPLTEEGEIFCSPQYTSSDLLKLNSKIRQGVAVGNSEMLKKFHQIVTIQLDLHPVGVIMYQMLTGKLPFEQLANPKITDANKIKLWQQFDVPLVSNLRKDVPVTIDNIIYRCTASRSDNLKYRYTTDEELEQELKKCLNVEVIKKTQLIAPLRERRLESATMIEELSTLKPDKFFNKKTMIGFSIISVLLVILLIVMAVIYATR